MKRIDGGVTAAKGFEAASTAAEIKYKNRTDMAMVYSQVPCKAAGTFTTNVVKAAPVKWDQMIVKESAYAQAVIVNSGIANACTGAQGYQYCQETADEAARVLGIPADAVLKAMFEKIYSFNGFESSITKSSAGIPNTRAASSAVSWQY